MLSVRGMWYNKEEKGGDTVKKQLAGTKNRWIAFSLAMVPFLIQLGLSILLLTRHICVNRAFVITYIALPLLGATLLAVCIFSSMKRHRKAIVTVLILLGFVVVSLFSSLVGQFEKVYHYEGDEAAAQYTAAEELNKMMPSLSEIGEPEKLEYYHVYANAYIFVWGTDYLICRYDPEEYALQKSLLEKKYIFQEETVTYNDSHCEPSVEMDGYRFRMLSVEKEYDDIYYPKYIVLVACSDEANEIIYLSYRDPDIDYLTSLKEFIIGNCGWRHVR